MNAPEPPPEDLRQLSPDQEHSALFFNLVLQQTNLALMFLGKTPHPETGQPAVDLDSAGFFIETLEMLAIKTKGNLSKEEQSLLQQGLTSARLAFVEAVEKAPLSRPVEQPPAEPADVPPQPEPAGQTPPAQPSPTEDEARKKFVKKY